MKNGRRLSGADLYDSPYYFKIGLPSAGLNARKIIRPMSRGNILKIGKLYITTDCCLFFNVAHRKNGTWVDGESADGMWFSEVPPGTSVLILSNPDYRFSSVALVGEQTLWVFDDDVDEL